MVAYNFGAGNWFCKRTDTANQTVTLLGVLQDMELNIDRTMKELIGQYALPVDVAQAQMKITGKGKYAQVGLGNLNNTILGQTQVSSSGFNIAAPENHTGALTLTVTNGATFSEDLGVRYHSNGNPLQPVTSSPNAGQYIAGAAGVGAYNFNSADTVSLDIYYSYQVSNMQQISAVNQLMGQGTTFELIGSNTYNVCGINKVISLKLNACKASRTSVPFKNIDYTMFDLEFQAFADCSNAWGTIAMTDA
jgi:ABC-type antimicrobial peptide transport system permease subunit